MYWAYRVIGFDPATGQGYSFMNETVDWTLRGHRGGVGCLQEFYLSHNAKDFRTLYISRDDGTGWNLYDSLCLVSG